jgi:hypothetical protein
MRSRFWRGLKSEKLKGALRHKYDAAGSFLDLQTYARNVELEMLEAGAGGAERKAKVHQQAIKEQRDSGSDVVAALAPVLERLGRLEVMMMERGQQAATPPASTSQQQGTGRPHPPPGDRGRPKKQTTCYRCQRVGHIARDCRAVLPENGKGPLSGSGQ